MRPLNECKDCGGTLDGDEFDSYRCSDCAIQHRDENNKSHCCNADLYAVEIAWSERYGSEYADARVCSRCETEEEI